jgi:uncharacterized membrane protein
MDETPSLARTLEQYRSFFRLFLNSLRQLKAEQWLTGFLVFAAVYYALAFSLYSVLLQETFNTQAFDAGIHDQGLWLLSRFLAPFVTVRGLNQFGDSVSLYRFFIAPLFWLWDNINLLYILQSCSLALGVLPLFLFARRRIGAAAAVAVGLAYLLYPALQNLNLDMYHSEALAVLFMSAALYCLLTDNFRWYYPAMLLTLVGKDEIALTVIFLGLYLILVRRQPRHGWITIACALAWYLICSRLFMPLSNGIGLFAPQPLTYSHWFRGLMENLFNPLYYLANIFHPESLLYYFGLLAPLCFLPLLSGPFLLLALPSVAVNVLSGVPYLRSIFYHYNYIQTAVLLFATVEGLAWLKSKYGNWLFSYAAALLLLSALIANQAYSHFPLFGQWRLIREKAVQLGSREVRSRQAALRLIPPGAQVSASYSLVPHLSHRREIYMFPNPFKAALWGQWFQEGKGLPPAAGHVDYLALDLDNLGPADRALADSLAAGRQYIPIYRDGPLLVLQSAALKRPDAAPPARGGTNLVRNGDFEEVVGEIPANWRVECWQDRDANCAYFADRQNHHHGRYAAALVHEGPADSRWVQEIAVKPNTKYVVSGWIKTAGISPVGAGAAICLMNTEYRSRILRGDNNWQYVKLEFTTDVDQRTVTLACRLGDYGATNVGRAYFDQLELKEVPDGSR